jgi:SAM-dependent methyltransferase
VTRPLSPARVDDAVVWHDVECAGYAADLPLWRRLAAERGGPVLDLGCGTGRVALDLAQLGHDVTGVDVDPALVEALRAGAREVGLAVQAEVGDIRALALGRRFPLAIAPMQVVQLLGGREERRRGLESVRGHLRPGGLLAAALANPFEGLPAAQAAPPMPDMREQDGWVWSSTPVALREEDQGRVAIDRLRQAVSPTGELAESMATIVLDAVPPAELEADGEAVGLRVRPAERVPETESYVASTVVLLEAA